MVSAMPDDDRFSRTPRPIERGDVQWHLRGKYKSREVPKLHLWEEREKWFLLFHISILSHSFWSCQIYKEFRDLSNNANLRQARAPENRRDSPEYEILLMKQTRAFHNWQSRVK